MDQDTQGIQNPEQHSRNRLGDLSGFALGMMMAGNLLHGKQDPAGIAKSREGFLKEKQPESETIQEVATDFHFTYEDDFSYEINTIKYFQEIINLKGIADNLPPDFDTPFGDYLRTTSWYENIEKSAQLESALNTISYTKVDGQPLQCVTFAMLLSALQDPQLPVQDISGAQSFGVGPDVAHNAVEFVPWELMKNKYQEVAVTGYGGVAVRTENFQIDDFEVGDVIVNTQMGRWVQIKTPDGKIERMPIGHVSVIMGKKQIGEKILLLVVEANRNNDGKISITEVDEDDYSTVIGTGDSTFVIRESRVWLEQGKP